MPDGTIVPVGPDTRIHQSPISEDDGSRGEVGQTEEDYTPSPSIISRDYEPADMDRFPDPISRPSSSRRGRDTGKGRAESGMLLQIF